MKKFMDEDFLLATETAKNLYHNYAEKLPIIDYHCHLSPQEIYEDVRYENITQVWLGADHYKWRQMRSNGVEEKYITGDASDREKFQKWAETLEKAIGNPLYHWSHLELKKYFGYEGHLCGDTAQEVWDLTSDIFFLLFLGTKILSITENASSPLILIIPIPEPIPVAIAAIVSLIFLTSDYFLPLYNNKKGCISHPFFIKYYCFFINTTTCLNGSSPSLFVDTYLSF